MANQFDMFTERALKVLSLSQDEAHRFNHNYIGTEHLLLGLVLEGEGVAARVLTRMGVQLPKVRSAVEFIIGRGDTRASQDIGLTPRASNVIKFAIDEAQRLDHNFIGTEHLLLGLVREGEGIAAGVLESLGVDLEKVRQQVMQVLSTSSTSDRPARTHRRTHRSKDVALSRELTVRSMRVLKFAREEAFHMRHGAIDLGHVLLGFLRESEGIAARVLLDIGVEIERVREIVSSRSEPEPDVVEEEIELSDRATAALVVSVKLAEQARVRQAGTGYLLLALCINESREFTEILDELGVDLDQVRNNVSVLLTD
jgi:ATP-dependent Clp protease ATP-binding subunit ClpA